MLIEIPDNVAEDVKGLIPDLLERAIEFNKTEQKRKEKIDRLNTEDNLDWFREWVFKYDTKHPLVRESYYKSRLANHQYIQGFSKLHGVNDPPVIMRGSRYAVHRKYSKTQFGHAPYGWYEKILDRYVRMSKVTVIPNRGGRSKQPIEWAKLEKNFKRYASRWVDPPSIGYFGDIMIGYINGKEFWCSEDQTPAMKSLFKQIQKVSDLEKALNRLGGSFSL